MLSLAAASTREPLWRLLRFVANPRLHQREWVGFRRALFSQAQGEIRLTVATESSADWDALYRDYADAVYVQARMILGNSDDAADVVQSVFEKAYKNWSRFDQTRSVKAWLLGIASNEALHYSRRRKMRAWLPLSETSKTIDDLPADSPVWEAVRDLSPRHRAVVALFYIHGFQADEIAAELDIPIGTVGSRLHVARNRLRELLSQSESGAGV